ncbi:hypothetical protein CEP52_017527, partial [Fusarium oligoseptatum]
MHLLKSFAAITLVAAPLSTAAVALQPTRTAQLEERFGPGLPDVIEPTPKQATEAAEDEDKDKDEDKANSRTYANHEIAEHYGSALSRRLGTAAVNYAAERRRVDGLTDELGAVRRGLSPASEDLECAKNERTEANQNETSRRPRAAKADVERRVTDLQDQLQKACVSIPPSTAGSAVAQTSGSFLQDSNIGAVPSVQRPGSVAGGVRSRFSMTPKTPPRERRGYQARDPWLTLEYNDAVADTSPWGN